MRGNPGRFGGGGIDDSESTDTGSDSGSSSIEEDTSTEPSDQPDDIQRVNDGPPSDGSTSSTDTGSTSSTPTGGGSPSAPENIDRVDPGPVSGGSGGSDTSDSSSSNSGSGSSTATDSTGGSMNDGSSQSPRPPQDVDRMDPGPVSGGSSDTTSEAATDTQPTNTGGRPPEDVDRVDPGPTTPGSRAPEDVDRVDPGAPGDEPAPEPPNQSGGDSEEMTGQPPRDPPERATDEDLRENILQNFADDREGSAEDYRITDFEQTEDGDFRAVVGTRDQTSGGDPVDVPEAYRDQIRDRATDDATFADEDDAQVVVTDDGDLGIAFRGPISVDEDGDLQLNNDAQPSERFARDPGESGAPQNVDRVDPGAPAVRRLDDVNSAPARMDPGPPEPRDADANEAVQQLNGDIDQQSDGPAQNVGNLDRARRQYAEQVSEQTGQDYSAEDVQINVEDGNVTLSVEQRETFDFDFSLGFGGPEDEVEQTIDDVGAAYSQRTTEAANNLFAVGSDSENSAGAILLRAAGQDDLASQYDNAVRNFGAAGYSGAAAIGNIPGIAGGLLEVGETGGAAVSQTASGSGGQFLSDAFSRGSALGSSALEQARESPFRTAGALGGSLAGSAGVLSAASRTSSRAGVAARYAIQPGEEIAGSLGFRATRATAGEGTAQRAFPNREPLIFSEEAAIRGGRAAADATRRAGSSAASGVSRRAQALRESLEAGGESRAQADLAGRSRSERSVDSDTNVISSDDIRSRQPDPEQGPSAFPDPQGRFEGGAGFSRGGSGSSPESTPAGERASSGQTRANYRSVAREVETAQTPPRANSPMTDLRTRANTEAEVGVDTDTLGMSRVGGRRRFETTVDTGVESATSRLRGAQQASLTGTEAGQASSSATQNRLQNAFQGGSRGRSSVRTELGIATELRSGARTQTETQTRTQTVTETALGTRSRSELASELGLEGTGRRRREFEPSDLRSDTSGQSPLLGGGGESASILERDLINPLTGE